MTDEASDTAEEEEEEDEEEEVLGEEPRAGAGVRTLMLV